MTQAAVTQVFIPSQLTSYTGGATRVDASGATVGSVLDDLDRRFPGLKFRVVDEQDRVRRHMRLFIGRRETRSVAAPLQDGDELLIFGALSGG
jgi:molybdopterin converting factor small subunit